MARPSSALAYAWRWATGPALLGRSPALPYLLNLPVTDNCNSRCVMCDLWKERSEGELTAADYRRVLADGLFARVEHVGVSGGEPSLRQDLPEIVEAVLDALPRLRSLSITTHGFLTRAWERQLGAVTAACRRRGVAFALHLSVDGVGELHDRVRGIPGGFARCQETRELARRLGVPVQLQATVCATNLYGAARLVRWAAERGDPLVLRQASPIERLRNAGSMRAVALDQAGRSYLADLLESDVLRGATRSPARRLLYRDLARRLALGGPRRAPCYFQGEGVLLDPRGDLYHCSIAAAPLGNARHASAREIYFSEASLRRREELLRGSCPGCLHDQSGAWSPGALALEVLRGTRAGRWLGRVAELASMGLRYGRLVGHGLVGERAAAATGVAPRAPRALVVGAYGGEHVGDAAILGGVLMRLRERGVAAVQVASFRPARTRRWLECLRLALPAEVVDVAAPGLGGALGPEDWVVHAGGPVMDLPRVLLAELEIVARARRRGARLLLEGVGVGPFRRRWAVHLARRLLDQAHELRVRTAEDAAHPLARGRRCEVTEDPAFTYLREVLRAPAPPPPAEAAALAGATPWAGAEGVARPLAIGLNIRPVWDRYLAGAGHSAAGLERRFQEELLAGMALVEASRPGRRIAWTLFAMNADELGFSDFGPSWRLLERAGGRHEVHLVEHELGVDGVLALLRRLDALVAMRLHASIFALAAGTPCLGVDYAVGEPGKVAALYAARGIPGRCVTLQGFTAAWLRAGLDELLPGPPAGA